MYLTWFDTSLNSKWCSYWLLLSHSPLQCGARLPTAGGTLPRDYGGPGWGVWCACTHSDQAHSSPFLLQPPQHQGPGQETPQKVFLVAVNVVKPHESLWAAGAHWCGLSFMGPKKGPTVTISLMVCVWGVSLNRWSFSKENLFTAIHPKYNRHQVKKWTGSKEGKVH